MILVLNTGSSSVKWAVFDGDTTEVLTGIIGGIGGTGTERIGADKRPANTKDHADAIGRILAALRERNLPPEALDGVGHRVVHGGTSLTKPTLITPAIRDTLQSLCALAPLHLPPALAGIDAMAIAAPGIRQAISLDTAFHADQGQIETTYALPTDAREAGLRRYGFHGLSYASLCATLGRDLPRRTLALHIGAGVSLCAIFEGRSVATTMGYSPLSGPPMATRSGDLDPLAVLALAQTHGIDGAAQMLARESGLLGLSAISGDMMTLEASGDPRAAFAIDHFCYWIARAAAGLLPALGGVDGIVFTGGIGENSERVRAGILCHLAWLSAVPVHVVAAAEERQIASECAPLLAAR